MKKFIPLFLICIGLQAHLYAQDDDHQARIDSLTKELARAKGDSQKARVLNSLAFDLKDLDAQQGLLYAKQTLELATKLKWTAEMGLAYNDLAANYHSLSDNTKALDSYLKALTIFENLKDSLGIDIADANIASIYDELQHYPEALQYDSASIKIATSIRDTEGIVSSLIKLSGTFISMKKYDEAIKALEYELTLAKSMHSARYEEEGLGSLGITYQQQHNYARSLSCYFKALKLCRELGDIPNEVIITGGAGETYRLIAIDTTQKIVADSLISPSRKVNLEKAKTLLSQAMALNKQLSNQGNAIEFLESLIDIDELEGNYKDAYEKLKVFDTYYDSSISKDVQVNIAALETKRERDLKEKQIEVNKLTTRQEQRERVLFIMGLVMLCIIIAFVYNNYKNQKKTSQMRAASLQQKDMLMREIHHRVKNNLQVISTLLDLQLVNITDDHAKDAITESTTRLKAISLIHQQLYQDEQITTIECAQFAKDLHAQISAVFNKPGQQVAFNNSIPPTILDIDTAVPIGLILNELMTNSYKYAFNGTDGSIGVNISKTATGYILTYTDSGPGLPDGMNVANLKSLGMKIVTRLSKQAGGKFSYDKSTNSFIITFMDIEGRKMID